MTSCCPCDEQDFPPEPQIAAGLSVLPRQVLGFPEYRRALLSAVRSQAPLGALRAREGDDLGLLFIESWAYVLDVLGFYDAQIAQNLYLRTATDAAAMRRLVELIGYRPRPATAAEAWLAVLLDRGPDVQVPAATAFRSEAFGSEPPQVFESSADTPFNARSNRWLLAPVMPAATAGGDRLLFDLRTLRLVRGNWAVFSGLPGTVVTRVQDLQAIRASDGAQYAEATVAPPLLLPAGTALAGISVRMPTVVAHLSRLATAAISGASVFLDAAYPQLQPGDEVLLVAGDARMLMSIGSVALAAPGTAGLALAPVSQITFTSNLVAPWSLSTSLALHFQFIDGGNLRRPAAVSLQRADLNGPVALAGVSLPLAAPAGGPLLLRDAELAGAQLDGTVTVDAHGAATLTPSTDTTPFTQALTPPIEVFANRLHVVRGETVAHEVLGSGDATLAWPRFKLKRKPLTYVPDSAAPQGRCSTLQVRVNGVAWREVDSFHGSAEDEPVFTVRLDEAQDATVTFRHLPSGVNNVVASYRWGAGAAKPPVGGISQTVRPVKGLARVIDVLGASGGSDADGPKDIRASAATSALTLGRAISVDDFEALARGFPGIVNVSARWAWDTAQQRAVVKLWFIADGGDPSDSLRSFLRGQADPDVPLATAAATPVPARLLVDFIEREGYLHADVEAALIAMLSNADTGLLAPRRVPIGGALFRSRLFEALAAVPGLKAVRTLTLDGAAMPAARVADDGCYLSFLPFTNR